jgi:branched-chain amino acid transport system substrate-binding protein
MRRSCGLGLVALVAVAALAASVEAQQKPIRIGYPMILSGGGALFGQPSSKGAEMYVKEINDKGGILGRKLELVIRDSKGAPEEATRVSRELILKEGVDFLAGGLSAAEGLAISAVAKEQKVVYVAAIPKTTNMTDPGKLHPYVFRAAANSYTEGRSAAVEMAKLPVSKIYTIGPDYEYGQVVTKAFADQLKKLKPGMQIVGQGWPKLGEQDHTPFITTALAARPDALFSTLWGGQFVTFAKQAKPYGLFDKLKVVTAGEGGSPETGMTLKDDMPLGVVTNSYDVFYYHPVPEHKDYVERVKKFFNQEYASSWASTGYIALQFLVEGIQKAGSTDTDKVIKALEGLSINSPIGKLTMRAKDHQATRGQFWGISAKVPEYPFPILNPVRYVPADDIMD